MTSARWTKRPYLLPREEQWEIFDRQAHRYLSMSGEEFLRAWDAGAIEDPDRSEVMRVVMLFPLRGRATVPRHD